MFWCHVVSIALRFIPALLHFSLEDISLLVLNNLQVVTEQGRGYTQVMKVLFMHELFNGVTS